MEKTILKIKPSDLNVSKFSRICPICKWNLDKKIEIKKIKKECRRCKYIDRKNYISLNDLRINFPNGCECKNKIIKTHHIRCNNCIYKNKPPLKYYNYCSSCDAYYGGDKYCPLCNIFNSS